MWKPKIIAQTDTGIRFHLQKEDNLLTFHEVFNLWQTSPPFRTFYIDLLANVPFSAFYWEHPGLITSNLEKSYEFVLLNSTSLDRRNLNETAFANFFESEDIVVDFDNLGKNARLVVPTPKGETIHYKHLAKFIRSDKIEQKHALFSQIGQVVLNRIEDQKTLWLNTAGNGVIWLHIRLDSRPKYYKTRAYKNPEFLKIGK